MNLLCFLTEVWMGSYFHEHQWLRNRCTLEKKAPARMSIDWGKRHPSNSLPKFLASWLVDSSSPQQLPTVYITLGKGFRKRVTFRNFSFIYFLETSRFLLLPEPYRVYLHERKFLFGGNNCMAEAQEGKQMAGKSLTGQQLDQVWCQLWGLCSLCRVALQG